MSKQSNPFRLNVGFIIHETPGYSREFEFAFPQIELAEDMHALNFKGTARFDRTRRGILLVSNFSATILNECTRCLDKISQDISTDFTELYAFDERTVTESGLIVPEDGYIDLKPMMREYMILSIPINSLCKTDCAGLCPICGTNHNHEQCDCKTDSIDPRLAKLKDLLDSDE